MLQVADARSDGIYSTTRQRGTQSQPSPLLKQAHVNLRDMSRDQTPTALLCQCVARALICPFDKIRYSESINQSGIY